MSSPGAGDEELLGRLADLALVEPDALVAGVDGDQAAALLEAFAGDLVDALSAARARAAELAQEIAGGTDPLSLVAATREVRVRDGGHAAEERAVARLAERQQAAALLCRLDRVAARVIPRLFEVERRVG